MGKGIQCMLIPGKMFALGQLHGAFGAFSNINVALCYKNPSASKQRLFILNNKNNKVLHRPKASFRM